MTARRIVLDANILVRAVLGRRVPDLIEEVEKRVASGTYGSVSEVALAGLRALFTKREREQ